MLPDVLIRLWLNGDQGYAPSLDTVGTTFAQVLPYNPMRSVLILGGNSGATVDYQLGDGILHPAQGTFFLGTGSPPLILTYQEHGQVMQFPVWARSSIASTAVVTTEVTWSPGRLAMAEEWIREHISKYAASR